MGLGPTLLDRSIHYINNGDVEAVIRFILAAYKRPKSVLELLVGLYMSDVPKEATEDIWAALHDRYSELIPLINQQLVSMDMGAAKRFKADSCHTLPLKGICHHQNDVVL